MDATWLILTLIALGFSALFSGIEIAFVTSDRVRVELDIQKGGLIGRCLSLFYSNPNFFISTILVGNNIVLVIYGIGAAKMLEPWLETLFHNQAWVLISQTLLSTLVILLTGEFFPKTIFRINPNRSLRLVAPFTALLYCLLYPVSLFSTWISKMLMSICGIKDKDTKLGIISMGDLNEYLEQTIDEKADEHAEVEREVQIFHNALDFSETHLRDCTSTPPTATRCRPCSPPRGGQRYWSTARTSTTCWATSTSASCSPPRSTGRNASSPWSTPPRPCWQAR